MSTAIASLVSPALNGLFTLIDDLFTSPEERENAKLRVLELEKSGELAQIGVNLKEAEHGSLFVAGWRPFVGWVCGLAFAWAFLVGPIVSYIMVVIGTPVSVIDTLPEADLSGLMPVLLGMLGLGAMRSWEKKEGVSRETLKDGVNRHANGT